MFQATSNWPYATRNHFKAGNNFTVPEVRKSMSGQGEKAPLLFLKNEIYARDLPAGSFSKIKPFRGKPCKREAYGAFAAVAAEVFFAVYFQCAALCAA